MHRSMFVPRLMDEGNLNAQNKNAQLILSHWPESDWHITTLTYDTPDRLVAARKDIEIVLLWRRHGWIPHLLLRYLRPYDLVFYPGVHAADVAGLQWRRRLGFSAPVISTLEGLVGNEAREEEYSAWAGHRVFCQHVSAEVLRRCDSLLELADHVIAISPFLAAMGKRRYGDKFSVLPLGLDTSRFYPPQARGDGRPKVISAGRLESHKRPEVFLMLAARHPEVDFVWYGEGSLRGALTRQAVARGLNNVAFAGNKSPDQLAEAFRDSDIFVFPSLSEGVPKVTQEAAACGLPVILFGYFEAPSVINGENGFVVWSDNELFDRLAELLSNPELAENMGTNGAQLGKGWDWDVLAPQWEFAIRSAIPALNKKSIITE